jgi:hypothetical protein
MEKWKRQRDAESGGGILTYMKKVEKRNFSRGPLKMTHLPKKSTKTKVKCIVTSNKKLKNHIK